MLYLNLLHLNATLIKPVKPSMPNKPSLSKATCERLDVSWNTVNNASFYQIQLQLLEQPKDQNKQSGLF